MSPQPDISVIIAAWKAQDFIGAAVRSALDQDGPFGLEVIVVSDASPDDTLGAARRAASGDTRLICDALRVNSGPSAARNRAIEIASGRYIAVLDADDSFEPGRLARLLAIAEQSGADIIVDNMTECPQPPAAAVQKPFLDRPAANRAHAITLATWLDPENAAEYGGALGYLKPLMRRETLSRTDQKYDESLRNSEDFYLIAGLLAEGAQMLFTPEPGYRYTIHAGSISHRLDPAHAQAIVAAQARFLAAYADRLDDASLQAMRRRGRWLTRLSVFEALVDALKARAPARALALLVRHPGQWPHIMRRLVAIGANKLKPASQRRLRGV